MYVREGVAVHVCACTCVWVCACMPDMQACVYCMSELGQAMSRAQKNLETTYLSGFYSSGYYIL